PPSSSSTNNQTDIPQSQNQAERLPPISKPSVQTKTARLTIHTRPKIAQVRLNSQSYIHDFTTTLPLYSPATYGRCGLPVAKPRCNT
ncbi:hypothetical protein TI05_19550, partial [Achromatium sp. WMS3]